MKRLEAEGHAREKDADASRSFLKMVLGCQDALMCEKERFEIMVAACEGNIKTMDAEKQRHDLVEAWGKLRSSEPLEVSVEIIKAVLKTWAALGSSEKESPTEQVNQLMTHMVPVIDSVLAAWLGEPLNSMSMALLEELQRLLGLADKLAEASVGAWAHHTSCSLVREQFL